MRIGRLDLAIVLGNLVMWTAVPLVARDSNSSLFMAVTAATCVWRPFTAAFMVGLMETSWEASKFRDLFLTPGRIVMFALLFRVGLLMVTERRTIQPGISRTLVLGLVLYVGATFLVSLNVHNPVAAYAAVAYAASAIGLIGLYSSSPGRQHALYALWFGMLPAIVYYALAFVGLVAPLLANQAGDGVAVGTGRFDLNSNAAALVLVSFLSVYVGTTTAGAWRLAGIVCAALGVVSVAATGSRSGLIALAAGGFLYFMLLGGQKFRIRSLARSVVVAGVMALMTVGVTQVFPDLALSSTLRSTWARLVDEAGQDATDSFRKRMWSGAVDHIAAAPLSPDYLAYRDEYTLQSHSTPLEVGLQGGVIGLAGFMIVLAVGAVGALALWLRLRNPWSVTIIAMLVARWIPMLVLAMPGDKMLLALVILVACEQAARPAASGPAVGPAPGLATTVSFP